MCQTVKTIAIGCDPNAITLKNDLSTYLTELGYTIVDYGSDDPIYANVAFQVAQAVATGQQDRGILLCGTGIGMSIAANKVHGAYAALCSDMYSAERAQRSNNANIITMGAQVIGSELAKHIARVWLEADFDPKSRSQPKLQRIIDYDLEGK
jgi:RpiB/LacA/LacB family sugar-phosphate isomerase